MALLNAALELPDLRCHVRDWWVHLKRLEVFDREGLATRLVFSAGVAVLLHDGLRNELFGLVR